MKISTLIGEDKTYDEMNDADFRMAKILGLMMSIENEIVQFKSPTSVTKKISSNLKQGINDMSKTISDIGDMYKKEMLRYAKKIEGKVDNL
jgi:archaellum component FlaC